MDGSVYTPGAGTLPPVLAGRDALLHRMGVLLNDVATVGRPRAQDLILVGPRGVGKTVTLTTYGGLAAAQGFEVVNLQAVAGHIGLVDSLLQRAQTRAAKAAGPWRRTKKAFDRLASINLGIGGVSAGVGLAPRDTRSRVDPGTLAETLVELAEHIRRDRPLGGLLVTVDELQVASAADLALLAATLHRLTVDFPRSAVVFAGTGLPHTPVVLRNAGVTHPDRLFILEDLPATLPVADAAFAVVEPARRAGIAWHPDATAAVIAASGAYPAHLQLFADTAWHHAAGPRTIEPGDAAAAIPAAQAEIERRTLGPRWDRMPDRQMEYLAALALAGGRATTGSIARSLGRTVTELSSLRDDLIREGDIYSPQRGWIALTVPTFADFVLARYEQTRTLAGITLLSLEELRRNRNSGT